MTTPSYASGRPPSSTGPEAETPAPMFSFLIPAYRTEPWIEETLDALVAQTSADWEAVVVDNGNVDAMAALIRPYTVDPRFRMVRQENQGYAGGINAAAAVARGRWFVPLASDDLVSANYCVAMAAAIDSHPNADALSPDAEMFDNADRRLWVQTFVQNSGVSRRDIPDGDLSLADLMNQQFLYYSAAFRRDAWEGVGGHASETPHVEDLDLWLRLVAGGWRVRTIPDVLGRYRVREDSMSHAADSIDGFIEESVQAFTRAARQSGRPEDLTALDVAVRRLRYTSAIRRARWALIDGDIGTARTESRIAFTHRRTLRAGAILAGLAVAPGLLRRIRPLKSWVTMRVSQGAALVRWGRSQL